MRIITLPGNTIIMETKNNLPNEFIKRLINQAKYLEGDLANYLPEFGLKPGMLTLEMGSCIGLHSKKVSEIVYPSRLVSLDMDFDYVSYQKTFISNSKGNIILLRGDALTLPLPNDYFDFVYSRFLFQHLINPLEGLLEVYRVLKSSGVVVVIDSDDFYDTFYPEFPGISFVREAYSALAKLQKKRGGDRFIGKKLIPLLVKAGFQNVGVKIFPTIQIGKQNQELVIYDILPIFKEEYENLIKFQLISSKHLNAALLAIENSVSRYDSFYMGLIFIAHGNK